MKIEIKNVVKLFAFLVCLLPVWTWAASYEVSTSTSIVDGDTFCGGSACASSDTIIIKGGARGALLFRDFNGAGSYITITNENTNPDSKVEITGDGAGGYGILSLCDCKYVDLRGDNDGDIAYGIKVINDGTPARSGTVWVYGESDDIKISYLEIAFDGNTTISGNGIQVQDVGLSTSWTFDTFEIHHNYIHNSRYAAMYLGHNQPAVDNNPYLGTFSIHDNVMENSGSYGITYKGVNGPNNYIYNNTVTTTGVIERSTPTDSGKHGIGVQFFYGNYYAEIYNNRIEKTVGPGLKIGGNKHLVYNNVIAGCGSGNDKNWGHGIITHQSARDVDIYANTIIQAQRYAIYGVSTKSATHRINIIGGSGIGEAGGTNLIEGTGDQANTYESDVSNLNFKIWSDDGDYSNDDFSLINSIKAPTKLSVQLTP